MLRNVSASMSRDTSFYVSIPRNKITVAILALRLSRRSNSGSRLNSKVFFSPSCANSFFSSGEASLYASGDKGKPTEQNSAFFRSKRSSSGSR